MRWGCLLVIGLALPRCSGCLPPLLKDQKAPVPVNGLPPAQNPPLENCTTDSDCTSGTCCISGTAGVCGACCQSSDCASGVCDSSLHICTTCGTSPTAACTSGQTCCASTCVAGSCCTDTDCAGNAGGAHCINGQCALAVCSGAGACPGGLCCGGACVAGAACCSASDFTGGALCVAGACVACDSAHACAAGQVCCAGACTAGTCCDASDCNAAKTCRDNTCASCNLSANDCASGKSCCADDVLGPICISDTGCCPSDTTACASASDPRARACDVTADTCGLCTSDSHCGGARTCCSDGACAHVSSSPAALGQECCADSGCASGVCNAATHLCSACRGSELCGTPTALAGVQVCDSASDSCVACDGTHLCGAGAVCCGGACFEGACCASSDCPSATPVCDPTTRLCTGCALDSDCGSGSVCVAAGGASACPGANQNCTCVSGTCHEQSRIDPVDCAGACCAHQCTAGGNCCVAGDCGGTNPGHNLASVCTSAQTAPAQQACIGSVCGCPLPTAGVLYVDPTGSDSAGNGSAACPFRSITKALASGGTTVNVRPGTYSGGETFPLVLPAGVTLERDPTCASGTVAIIRADGSTTSCPLQHLAGGTSSCAIAVSGAGSVLRDLAVKNTKGWAIVFGSGADATTQLVSGTIGCEGAGCSANGGADLAFVGTAAPTIGPADGATATLTLAPATNALYIVDSAAPTIRNVQNLLGFSSDVIRIDDTSSPSLRNLILNWPSGTVGANASFGVNITGSGGAVTLDHVWMYGSASGGVRLSRSGSGVHAWNDVRVSASGGNPNQTRGFGLLLDAPSGTSHVNLTGGVLAKNNGDGAIIDNAVVSLQGVTIQDSGRYAGSGCQGGNGVTVGAGNANLAVSGATITGSLGSTTSSCNNGNGIRVAQGIATVASSIIANNAFDGVRVESQVSTADIHGNVISGNLANGINLLFSFTTPPPRSVGQCASTCSGGDNIFDCPIASGSNPGAAGNGRANLCLDTPLAGVNQLAQNNQWVSRPPTVGQQSASFTNVSCATGTSADVIMITPLFGIATSSVATSPEQTALSCP